MIALAVGAGVPWAEKPQLAHRTARSSCRSSWRQRGQLVQPARSEEKDAPLERREEEDAQRYPAHEDPERVIDPDEEA